MAAASSKPGRFPGQVASDTGDLPGDHLNSPGVIPVKCWTDQNRMY